MLTISAVVLTAASAEAAVSLTASVASEGVRAFCEGVSVLSGVAAVVFSLLSGANASSDAEEGTAESAALMIASLILPAELLRVAAIIITQTNAATDDIQVLLTCGYIGVFSFLVLSFFMLSLLNFKFMVSCRYSFCRAVWQDNLRGAV